MCVYVSGGEDYAVFRIRPKSNVVVDCVVYTRGFRGKVWRENIQTLMFIQFPWWSFYFEYSTVVCFVLFFFLNLQDFYTNVGSFIYNFYNHQSLTWVRKSRNSATIAQCSERRTISFSKKELAHIATALRALRYTTQFDLYKNSYEDNLRAAKEKSYRGE